ncbi:General transcription factor IIH subunit [Dirofilaria immitis]
MAPRKYSPPKITEEDVDTIMKLCHCTVQTFESIGDVFLINFNGRHTSFSIGSALLLAFRESDGIENLRHRIILIYLLYRSAELDGVATEDDILEHPFLSFFLAVMEYNKDSKDSSMEIEMLGYPKLGVREKYITGCLLTGMLDRITNRTPVDITMMKIPKQDFDITRHITALKNRQAKYPSVASVTAPAIIRILNERTKNQDKLIGVESLASVLLPNLLINPYVFEILPPSFHRIIPSLMPPSDDEFQFLYPFILDLLWMETSVEKQDARALSTVSQILDPLTTVVHENQMRKEKSEKIELKTSVISLLSAKEVQPNSVDVSDKTGSSLPSTMTSASDNQKFSGFCRTSSIFVLSEENVDMITGADVTQPEMDATVETAGLVAISSVSPVKKHPMTSVEVAELLKKSLVSIITRTEAQKLAEAIAKDPSLAKFIDIPLTKFDKYIDDNPAIAAAVIVARITQNCNELPQFFQLLAGMKISVQAMEVVNRLCTQVEFPQEYLNNYIATCVRRCEEPDQTPFMQCRQVRVVCVFLSSLIRSRTWDVRPLSVELQAFVLKFNHVREAASLYQAILMALQPSTDSVISCSSSTLGLSTVTGSITTVMTPSVSMSNWKGQPLLEYLSGRTIDQLDKLYSSPAVSFAIFRLLPELSQQLILKTLWLCGYDKKCEWRAWSAPDFETSVMNHIDGLRKLRIITGDEKVMLNPLYRRAYLKATRIGLCKASELNLVTDCDERTRKSGNKDLGKKAIARWECILHYLALPSQKSEQGVSGTTKMLFRSAGLTSSESDSGNMEITSAGFQFLLLNRSEQIWTYLLHYFHMQEIAGIDIIKELDFLFRLTLYSGNTSGGTSFANGSDYKDRHASSRAFLIDESWSGLIKDFLMHLRELGLVFIRKRKDGFFFLTPLLNHLTSAFYASETNIENRNQSGFVIVETNYRVYAYTDSSLQLAILSTFTEMLYRFNDMSVGVLSREAIRRAFQVGITASQIIAFLRTNAHPTTLTITTEYGGVMQSLPITVADQIRLWEDERRRLIFCNAAIYSSFESESEYLGLKEYVSSQAILLWYDDVQKLVVITEEGHESVKAWWKMKASKNGS